MTDLDGRWARLPQGRLVRIIGVEDDVVLAERTTGSTLERPLAHVEARWRLLDDDCLSVRAVTDPAGLADLAESGPVDLVVEALRELGGEAETQEIKWLLERAVGQWVGTGDAFKSWWRRIQQKLGDDPRIDDSRSLQRRYRLLGPGETKPQALRGRLSDRERGGRRLADAPTLRKARERALRKRPPLSHDERLDLEREAALADLPDLDATDRFMAAELGTWIGLRAVPDAVRVLDEDLLRLDLLRVRHKASKDAALRWLRTWLESRDEQPEVGANAPPTVASAMALGGKLAEQVASLAADLEIPRSALVEGALTWSFPGSPEAEPKKLPNDYAPYLARLERFGAQLATADPDALVGIERGALRVLAGLAGSKAHASREAEVVAVLARLAASGRGLLAAAAMSPPTAIAKLAPARLNALLQVPTGSGGGWARTYLPAVELAFERDPWEYRGTVELIGTLIGEDPGAIVLRVTRRAARRERIALMALAGARIATESSTRADCVALAGTADPDDPGVVPELVGLATAVGDALLEGRVEAPGLLVFGPSAWREFATRVLERTSAADTREAAAKATMEAAERLVVESEAVAEQARAALAATRLSSEAQSRVSTARLVAHVLKPVAAALADSIEAPSVEALQDRLAAILDRARIDPILEPGDVRPFDPSVHRWVGDGDPTELVIAVSPGFFARLEGEGDIVLVPARVVAPPQG